MKNRKSSSKKAFVTGIAGFVGSHLTEHLLAKKIEVYGLYHPQHSTQNIDHLKDKINLVAGDLAKSKQVKKILKDVKPTYVFHLAASSSPSQSFEKPREALENNIFGELNLLEALRDIKSTAKILIIGSSEEYGAVDKKYLPISEDVPFSPLSPYAVSKIAQDILGLQYFLHEKLNTVRVRPFNHIGPRQSTIFAIPAFANQIAQLEKEGGGEIKVGNLKSYRDFTDVRDIVAAYLLALERGRPGEVYNIGSGKAVKMSFVLKLMLEMAKAKITIKVDKSKFMPIDIKTVNCDFSKFLKDTGWKPTIPLKTSLFDTITYERQKFS